MPRKLKYPNAEKTIFDFFKAVSDSYRNPGKDEKGRDGFKKQELVAEEFQISRIKVRKILITTGDLSFPETEKIRKLITAGKTIAEIAELLHMAPSTINSMLPYSKGIYKLSEVSAAAERTAKYRARKAAIAELRKESSSENLWKCICLFAGYAFRIFIERAGGAGKDEIKYTYAVVKCDDTCAGVTCDVPGGEDGDAILLSVAGRTVMVSRERAEAVFWKMMESRDTKNQLDK